jgi:hypothetical protein
MIDPATVVAADCELVASTCAYSFDEALPDTTVAERFQRVNFSIPIIVIADQRYCTCIWCPDREVGAKEFSAAISQNMRTERFPEPFMSSLADEVKIELAKASHSAKTTFYFERVSMGL